MRCSVQALSLTARSAVCGLGSILNNNNLGGSLPEEFSVFAGLSLM